MGGPVQCVVLLEHLPGLGADQAQAEAHAAALVALDYWLSHLAACEHLQPLANHVAFTCGEAGFTGAVAWAQLRGLPASVVKPAHDGVMAAGSSAGAGLLVIDASCVFGDSFSLCRFLDTAILRGRDVALFCRDRAAGGSQPGAVAATAADLSRCPLLLQTGSEAAKPGRACSVLPCLLLTAATRQQLGSLPGKRLVAALFAQQGQLYGCEVRQCWSAAAWLQQATAAAAAADSDSQPSSAVPPQFQDAGRWDYSCLKAEHTVYQTSSGAYGSVPPSQHDLTPSWAGIRGGLRGLEPQKGTTALKTGLRKSNVHSALEGW